MGRVTTPTPEPGTLIARRYRLQRELGRGAMGSVWAAFDEELHRPVAVKAVLRPPGMPDSRAVEMRERALREARAIAALSHPNTVTLYDVVRQDGEPFVVMELVTSASLNDLIRDRGPLSVVQVAAVANAVAAALDAAHRAGITHRDVKPGNVLVAEDGRIKLTDFGISRNVAEATLTSGGMMLGTPAYIAPEVAAGQKVTPAADLWSLGATLFTALSGYPPYDAGNVLRTVNEVVHGAVPEPVNAGELAPVVAGLMTKDPAVRMSLVDVQRRVYPLLPEPGTPLFPPKVADAVPPPPTRPVVRVTPKPVIAPDTPLAADPGPLPFPLRETTAVAEPEPPIRRRPWVTALVGVAAVLMFLVGTAGGFAATRTAAGQSLLPPPSPVARTLPPAVTVTTLAPRTAVAVHLNGEQGGKFTVQVAPDWATYVEQRSDGPLASTVVRFVSPDGVHQFSVQRLPGYYGTGQKIESYLQRQRNSWGNGDHYNELSRAPVAALSTSSPEGGMEISYRTVETSVAAEKGAGGDGENDLGRVHYARLLPHDQDLWVIELTSPVDQEESSRDLFTKIAETFELIDG